jgi:hypothetical protein
MLERIVVGCVVSTLVLSAACARPAAKAASPASASSPSSPSAAPEEASARPSPRESGASAPPAWAPDREKRDTTKAGWFVTAKGVNSACGDATMNVVFDETSFKAGHTKLGLAPKNAANANNGFTLDQALNDAAANCMYALQSLEETCGRSEAARRAFKASIKTIRCSLLDGAKTAAPQQRLENGTWNVKYTWWSNINDFAGFEAGVVDSLKITPAPRRSDFGARGSAETARCNAPNDCPSGLLCMHGPSPWKGPHCLERSRLLCSATGEAFGHADLACDAGEWCSSSGVCFPKEQFPIEGHELPKGARCYYDRECKSQNCANAGSGGNAFARIVGKCTE